MNTGSNNDCTTWDKSKLKEFYLIGNKAFTCANQFLISWGGIKKTAKMVVLPSGVFVNDSVHDEEVRLVKVGNSHAGDRHREMTTKLDRMGVSCPRSALRNSRA